VNDAVLLVLLVLTVACSAAQREGAESPANEVAPAPSVDGLNEGQKVPEKPVPAAPGAQARSETEPVASLVEGSRVQHDGPSEGARIVIRNAYLKPQYVFLNRELLGSVEPGAQVTFDIPPGAHAVVFSDSHDGRSNPKSLSEVFDAGYAYHYDVVAH